MGKRIWPKALRTGCCFGVAESKKAAVVKNLICFLLVLDDRDSVTIKVLMFWVSSCLHPGEDS